MSEHDDVNVDRLEVRRAQAVLLERAEGDEVVMAEGLDLLARLLVEDVFRGKGMNSERLSHFVSFASGEMRLGRPT